MAGIAALDGDSQGNIIGDPLPEQRTVNLIDLLVGKYKLNNGDRKLVVRSDLYKSVAPQMTFSGEKNFNPHYMHLQISQNHDFLVMNKVLCIVEYQPEGMSNGIFRQYRNSPRSFAQIRRLYLSFPNTSLKFRFKHCVHYVSSSIIAKDRSFLRTTPAKWLTVLAVPFGVGKQPDQVTILPDFFQIDVKPSGFLFQMSVILMCLFHNGVSFMIFR